MGTELPRSRLATLDASGKRVYLYPATVRGRYQNRKKWVHAGLVLFFLVLPWVHVSGRQLLLLDVARREFFFFGLHFRAHDAPLTLFALLSFVFLIGLITVVWGRLWCGWACPQTVFTEFLFRKIETLIEGNHLERRALDQAPLSAHKTGKKLAKWSAFVALSLIISHSFLAYFVGSRELLTMITSNPTQNWASFLVILFTTGVILFDFAWFREQFCVIMCPYGRFQSVLLDKNSLVVGYDTKRGEPRRGAVPPDATQGDCVDCYRCVNVCPTGIDIRRGLQMECIGCTACIDACDEVMTKTRKPTGLIRYTSLHELAGKSKNLSFRAVLYGTLFLSTVSALTVTLMKKDFLETTILRASGAPYEILREGNEEIIVNHFRIDLSNQTDADEQIEFSLAESAKQSGMVLVFPLNPVKLKNNANLRLDFFVRFPRRKGDSKTKNIDLLIRDSKQTRRTEINLVGPDA